MLRLVEPTKENLQKIKAGITELKDNPSPYDIGRAKALISFLDKNFEGYLEDWQQRRGKGKEQQQGFVPDTTLFLFDNDKFIGLYNIRHYLDDFLRTQGGHIAYQIIPSERGKGYAKQGLKLVLNWCHDKLGLDEVMLSCNAENHSSDRVMTCVMNEVGGHRDPDLKINNHIEHRVWIKTQKPLNKLYVSIPSSSGRKFRHGDFRG